MDNFHNSEINIPITNKLFSLYKTFYRYLKCFPKKERYTLGENIENHILKIFTQIHYINQLPNALKENELYKLNAINETLKKLFRLSYEIKVLGEKEYLTISENTQEIGKMIGGWIKYLKSNR